MEIATSLFLVMTQRAYNVNYKSCDILLFEVIDVPVLNREEILKTVTENLLHCYLLTKDDSNSQHI